MTCSKCGKDHPRQGVEEVISEDEMKFAVTTISEALRRNNVKVFTGLAAMEILKKEAEEHLGITVTGVVQHLNPEDIN